MEYKCAKCGAQLEDRVSFCTNCGATVEKPNKEAPSPPSSDDIPIKAEEKLDASVAVMDNKCAKCGALLEEGISFCTNCGAAVEKPRMETPSQTPSVDKPTKAEEKLDASAAVVDNKCAKCGTQLEDGISFCTNCGAKAEKPRKEAPSPPPSVDLPMEAMKEEVPSLSTTVPAVQAEDKSVVIPDKTGETVIGQTGTDRQGAQPNPVQVIVDAATGYISSVVSSFRDVKKLIPAIVLGVVWLVLIILPRAGVNPLSVRILSFVTFAQGGVSNSIFRMAGGLVGKGMFAYLIAALITPVQNGRNPFADLSKGAGRLIGSYKNISHNIVPLLIGAGFALLFYNFLAGYASLWKSMAGVTAIFLSLRSVGSGGLMMRLLNSFFRKRSRSFDATNIMAGLTAGFALAIPVSAIPYVYICYLLGTLMLIAAAVLIIVKSAKKGAVVQ